MTAFNVVRFRTRPDRESHFVEAHRQARADFDGLVRAMLVKTGERGFCFVGEWRSVDHLAAARPRYRLGVRQLAVDGDGLAVGAARLRRRHIGCSNRPVRTRQPGGVGGARTAMIGPIPMGSSRCMGMKCPSRERERTVPARAPTARRERPA